MRKILLGFTTLLMLTPVLTCVMAFCPMQSAQAADPKPCHQSEDNKKDGLMLALDCMQVDLFQQDTLLDATQPDSSLEHIDFAWTNLTSNYDFSSLTGHFIRGPPFDRNPLHINTRNLYLTTQRQRI